MATERLKDPACIPVKIRDGGVVIRMFLICELLSPLFRRIKRLVGRIIGLIQEPWAASICLDEANTLVGLHVRAVRGLVRLAYPMTQKRIEALEGIEESW